MRVDTTEADFNRWKLSEKDFEEAHTYLSEFNTDLSMVVQRALLTAAIVAYARPFKRSRAAEGKASARAPTTLLDALDAEERRLHERIIGIRDEGVAHSDFDRKPTRRVARQDAFMMTWSKPFDVLGEDINIDTFKSMTWRLHMQCIQEMFNIHRQAKHTPVAAPSNISGDGEVALRIPLSAFKPR
jgi:hypothetical protein